MTESFSKFQDSMAESLLCFQNFEGSGHDFCLRYIWILSISAFDLYMTDLITEAGLRFIDKFPRKIPNNLRKVELPLASVLEFSGLSPAERLLFFKHYIFLSVQFDSFYRPDKVSEALSYIWTCPPKEKWGRITKRYNDINRESVSTEEDIRGRLTLIGDRRDIIAHSVDISPGLLAKNTVNKEDAASVVKLIRGLAQAVDDETESQLREHDIA